MNFELDRKEVEYVFRGGPEWPVMAATLRWPTPDAVRGLYRQIYTHSRPVASTNGAKPSGMEVERVDPEVDYGTFFAEHLTGLRRIDGKELSDPIQEWKDYFQTHRESRVPLQLVLFTMLATDVRRQSSPNGFSLAFLDTGGIETLNYEYLEPKETKGGLIDRNEGVTITHFLAPATVEQEERYRRSVTVSFDDAGSRKEVIDPLGFTRVYAERILRIEGASWKGASPTAGLAQRTAWPRPSGLP